MPITRKQFEWGIDAKTQEWMERIHSLLTASKEEAFGSTELYERVMPSRVKDLKSKKTLTASESWKLRSEQRDFDVALEKLGEIGAVTRKRIRNDYYYSYGPYPLEL